MSAWSLWRGDRDDSNKLQNVSLTIERDIFKILGHKIKFLNNLEL